MRLVALLLPWLFFCPAVLLVAEPQAEPQQNVVDGPSSLSSPGGAAAASGKGIQLAPPPKEYPFTRRPKFTIAVNTLGGVTEITAPLTRRIELRSGINFLVFGYVVGLNGMDFHARFHSESSHTTVDWFPLRNDGFHISPGLFYFRNSADGATSVAPGQSFTLGSAGFISSIDDPVHGSAQVNYTRRIGPMLTVGFADVPPRKGHISIPMEFGAAYTGAAAISMKLQGTACTTEGCFSFNSNPTAVASLAQQVAKLNHYLSKVPVYPIVSMGVTYHF